VCGFVVTGDVDKGAMAVTLPNEVSIQKPTSLTDVSAAFGVRFLRRRKIVFVCRLCTNY
jgi:hypothetical protein